MFKTFPEFSKLTLADREAYEMLIKDYPPIYDISFSGLMTWWNPLDNMAVSLLNGNLVIPYWLAGDEKHSGLSLVGANKVDESLCILFDHLREKGERQQLVNVPELVVANVQYPSMFTFKEERFYNEYILPISNFFPMKNMAGHRRKKVERQLARIGEKEVVTKSLDLTQKENREFLWRAVLEWQSKGINNYGKLEQDAIRLCLDHNELLRLENVCLFVDGELYGFCLYEVGRDKKHVAVRHIKATHVSTLGFELIAYHFAKWFAEKEMLYANVYADYGLLRLRMFMLTLGPHNFFRKYKVEPA